MTEALDSLLSDLRRAADAERIAGRYQQAALMSEAAQHIELLRNSTKPATTSTTDERKERDKRIGKINQKIEDLQFKARTLRRDAQNNEFQINELDAQRWALILTP